MDCFILERIAIGLQQMLLVIVLHHAINVMLVQVVQYVHVQDHVIYQILQNGVA
jgi:hypothetical protein